jgi:hypothetical protein
MTPSSLRLHPISEDWLYEYGAIVGWNWPGAHPEFFIWGGGVGGGGADHTVMHNLCVILKINHVVGLTLP